MDMYTNLQNTKEITSTEVESILKEAVFRNVHIKAKGRISGHSELIVSSKSSNVITQLFHHLQRTVLLADNNQCGDIRENFDSLLVEKQIYAKTAVKIVASGYSREMVSYSGDTLSMTIDERVNYVMDNGLGEIEYIVYIDYLLNPLWLIIFKQTFFGFMALAFFFFFGILFLTKSRAKQEKDSRNVTEIVTVTEICPSKTVTTQLDGYPIIQGKHILFNGKCKKMAPQSLKLLQFFLCAEQHLVNKNELKDIWVYNSDPLSSMTSAINRLNRYLVHVDCPYTIVTYRDNREYYKLEVLEAQP